MKKPCEPDSLPLTDLDWKTLLNPLSEAMGAIARYDGLLLALPNPSVLLSPITANEAVLSSRIEGTQATLEEVLQQDAGIDQGSEFKRDEIFEVLNYRKALSLAEDASSERPLSLSFVRQLHTYLLTGVRGAEKTPGEFRKDQNWIGRPGCSMDQARFIPPSPLRLLDLLENWETYLNGTTDHPVLHVAVTHAQFEILHPFKDGNGRIGRILIPLLFYRRGVLHRPMFYLSEFLEANRPLYYDRLLGITKDGDWFSWILFFANAVKEQAEANFNRARAIFQLYGELKPQFQEATSSKFAINAQDAFFISPVINATKFQKLANIDNRVTVNSILKSLTDAGLIERIRESAGRKPAVYALRTLLEVAEGRPVRFV